MGFFSKIKDGVKSLQAMGQMDDKVAEEMYRIFAEFGYQTDGFKHKPSRMKTKADGASKMVPERWKWTVTTGAGTFKIRVTEDMGVMKARARGPTGTKKKTKFEYKRYVQRDGTELEIVNRDQLVEQCKKLLM